MKKACPLFSAPSICTDTSFKCVLNRIQTRYSDKQWQLAPSALCPHIGAGSGKKRSDSEKLQCFMKRMQIIHYIFLLTYHVLIARRLLGAEGCDFVKTEWTSRIVRLEFESLGWNCLAMLPRKSNWNSPGYHFLICIRKMMPMFQVY